jgi:hypothetical protein
MVILFEKDHQDDAEEEKDNKIQGFSNINSSFVDSYIRIWANESNLCL